uniref:Protein artemis n=1 Tax=Kalanchoe fedtschenkoi TaxID=63787 RepID=A0A7N0ZUW6_KALFE
MEAGLISVDRWAEGSQSYFLTHLHSDHTNGLSPKWSRGPLFCSRITAKLFPCKFPGFSLSLLRVLELGIWYHVPLVSSLTGSETVVSVMAIDAQHCPGAVMYLFRGAFGFMLYTGDFRWEASSEKAEMGRKMLLSALNGMKVDTLHIDNTYCNPSYSFPSRKGAAKQVIDVIAAHPEHDIIIGIDNLGKEDLLVYIAHVLNIKIWVWPERLQIMHLLGFHDIFTTKTSLTRVRAVPRYSFSIETIEDMNEMRPTIGIMPSGLPWVVGSVDRSTRFFSPPLNSVQKNCSWNINEERDNPSKGLHLLIYSIPYSDHSCFSEIQDFVNLVQPANMRGIVSSTSCYIDPRYFFGRQSNYLNSLRESFEWEEGSDRLKSIRKKLDYGRYKIAQKCEKSPRQTRVDFSCGRVRRVRRKKRGAKILEDQRNDG